MEIFHDFPIFLNAKHPLNGTCQEPCHLGLPHMGFHGDSIPTTSSSHVRPQMLIVPPIDGFPPMYNLFMDWWPSNMDISPRSRLMAHFSFAVSAGLLIHSVSKMLYSLLLFWDILAQSQSIKIFGLDDQPPNIVFFRSHLRRMYLQGLSFGVFLALVSVFNSTHPITHAKLLGFCHIQPCKYVA